MPSRLTGFVCPTVSMVTTGHATGVEKTLLIQLVLKSIDSHELFRGVQSILIAELGLCSTCLVSVQTL